MSTFADYRDHVGALPDKQFKSTIFRSGHLMLGLNCLSPGQEQHLHEHAGQDKFYFVIEGTGRFEVGADSRTVGEGHVVWAPAGVPHGVRNDAGGRLVLLVGIAPFPSAS
jgi:quercetin dioxygenase-like cupin family protein